MKTKWYKEEDWYNEKRDGGLEVWEKALKEELVDTYNDKDYLAMLVSYCHEGLYLERKGTYIASICSNAGYGVTAELAIEDLANAVIVDIVEKNTLGC